VFTDDLQRILEKEAILCPECDHSAVMVKLNFFSKQDQNLEVNVSSCKFKVGKTMRVLGVVFSSY
jgi:hypothetical protein